MSFPDQRRVLDATLPDRNRRVTTSQTTNLADLLERVLDKGVVIAGDITLALGEVEILNIKVRLLVASIDKAQEIGIDWWRSDPTLSSRARAGQLERENQLLKERLERLEDRLLRSAPFQSSVTTGNQERSGDDGISGEPAAPDEQL